MKHHRGSVGMMHNLIQNMLVDVLEQRYRMEKTRPNIRKEWEISSKIEYGKSWVMDVADLTDITHPVYYEVQKGSNDSFREKLFAVAGHTGFDIVPIFIDEMEQALGKNPRVNDLRKWLQERMI